MNGPVLWGQVKSAFRIAPDHPDMQGLYERFGLK